MNKKDCLFEIADQQQGYFTSLQAKNCGYYDGHFPRYIKSGEWLHIKRGIYRLAHYPLNDRPDLVEWSLWSRNKQGENEGVWSHETALDLYDLCDIMPAKLHLTVPKHFRRSNLPPHLKLYFADLKKSDWSQKQGYRITTPIRTLWDLAQTQQISNEHLECAIHEAKKTGLITQQEINNLPSSIAKTVFKDFYEKN